MTQGGNRPTKAERKEAAKQARLAEMKRRQRQARVRKIRNIVIAVVAVGLIAGFIAFNSAKSGKKAKDLDKLAVAAGCSKIENPTDLGQGHTTAITEKVTYNTTPPTSGRHFGQWAPTGVHTAPVQNEVQVHNLEHGHVAIQYKPDIDQGFIDKLEGLAKVDPTRVLVAPYPDMPSKLAITSWAHISTCNDTKDSFIDFAKAYIDFYKGKGPEGDIPATPQA